MSIDVKFSGGPELERALKRLPARIEQKVARQALRVGGKVYQRALKKELPRSTGAGPHLADSIVVARPRDRRRDLFVAVGVQGVARLYAHIVEFGNSAQAAQPVWRPVFRRFGAAVINAVAEKLGKDIIKEVRRGN